MTTVQTSTPASSLQAVPIAPTEASARHIPELDGLRGVAVLMVIVGHGTHHTLLAVTGVSLFFVLSGFLITRILLRSVEKPHYFFNFYVRRALRIWPLYYLILAVTFLTPLFEFSHTAVPAWQYALYIQNFWVMKGQPPILNPTWSLAIEEQFYLAWPLIVLLCRSPANVGVVSLILILATPLFRLLYYVHGVDPYALTFGRLDGLASGAVLAVVSLVWPRRRGKVMLLGMCMSLSLCMLPLLRQVMLRKALKDTATNLMFLGLIGFAFYWNGTRWTGLFRTPVLRYFGTISYCAYLVHLPLMYAFGFPRAFMLTVVIATASFFFFEQPILHLKDRFTRLDPA